MFLSLDLEIKSKLTEFAIPPNGTSSSHNEISNQLFNQIMALNGKVYRELENRRTQRIVLDKKPYFVKQHFGVGWKEVFKNLFQLRLPVVSAKNEWKAIRRLQHLNIATPQIVGYGFRGLNPARLQSFLITRELPQFITLEDLCRNWKNNPPGFCFKYTLIQEVARIARTLHENGINHRDFYICHFLLDLIEYNTNKLKLYLIDLHRAQIRHRVPMRWVIKDLAGLYFSSKDIGLTQRDLWRFLKLYRRQPLRDVLNKETSFWLKVKKRGEKLYQDHEQR